ncbi:WD40 repeat-like protein [Rhizopogon salebrosus TDB-379]|nr:WD40 repeat-like protein [Rhizopogon salebrosus TDB-379]
MLRDKAKSGGSTRRVKVKRVTLVDSPTRVAPLTSTKDPPPYGAQHRQDALWEVEVASLWDLIHVSLSRAQRDSRIEMRSTVALKQRKRIRPVSKMLHELERAEEVDEDDDKGEKARRIESVRGRSWGEDEPAQCLSRPLGNVIPFVVPGRYFKPLIDVMLLDKAKSSGSTKQGNVMGVALVHSPTRVSPLKGAKNPPPYGAQHLQDALWEEEVGGNEALPPRWQQFKVGGGRTQYSDDNSVMVSWNRPIPGVRLDEPGELTPGWEWHISPLGRSYFINHNAQTTSWKKPAPDHPAGSLTPECIIEGHSDCIWSLACVGTGCNIMSASSDGSIRQWKRDREPVGEPWKSDGRATMALERGGVVGNPWEGHSDTVRCLDWSPNAKEIASGSQDGIIRRWNLNTGRQIAPPIETGHGWVNAVKYSPRGDKFASCGYDGVIRVWSKDGKLLLEIKGHDNSVLCLCWSKDGAYIFSGSVGDPLLHDDELSAIAIPSDGRYIASAGLDKKIYVWSFEAALKQSRNQVRVRAYIAIVNIISNWPCMMATRSPTAHASSSKDIFDVSPLPKRQANNEGLTRYSDGKLKASHFQFPFRTTSHFFTMDTRLDLETFLTHRPYLNSSQQRRLDTLLCQEMTLGR